MGIAMIILGTIALMLIVWRVSYKLRNRFIGYGWLVSYNPEDGSVFVKTRLLESPAGKSGVEIGSVILEKNGEKISYNSKEEYFQDFKQGVGRLAAKKIGEKAEFRILKDGEERVVTMHAVPIWGPIPYYGTWSHAQMDRLQTEGHFVPDYCKRTGVHYLRFFRNRYHNNY